MRGVTALILAVAVAAPAMADCPAEAITPGAPIPSFAALSKRSLLPEWEQYVAKYPNTRRSLYKPSGLDGIRGIADQCLVMFQPTDPVGVQREYVIQQPCDAIEIGATYHLLKVSYCLDVRGREPDFYEFVGHRNVTITTQTAFPKQPPNPLIEHVHRTVTYTPI